MSKNNAASILERIETIKADPTKTEAIRSALKVLHRAELLMLEAQSLVAQSAFEYAKVIGEVEENMVGVVTAFHNVFVEDIQYARRRMEFLLPSAEADEATTDVPATEAA